jgi:hypothetical protein
MGYSQHPQIYLLQKIERLRRIAHVCTQETVQLRPVVCGKRLQRLYAVDNSRTSQVSPQYDPVKRVER